MYYCWLIWPCAFHLTINSELFFLTFCNCTGVWISPRTRVESLPGQENVMAVCMFGKSPESLILTVEVK